MSLYFKPAGTNGGGGGGPLPWTTASAYVAGQQIYYGGGFYDCIVAHTSGTNFVDDLALGKWAYINSAAHQNPNLMLAFNNFEANSALGWTATGCATVTNGLPVSVGSGGAVFSTSNGGRAKGGNTTAAAVTSSGPIDGIYSLNLATSGAGTIGDGYISQLIPISIGYQAKVLVASCKFKVASGTPVMVGTSADTYAIAIYDVTNNAWLPVNGAFSFTQISGVGDCRVTFQTASTTAAVQIFIYSPIAPVGASSLLLDNFVLCQQSVAYGSPVTDWQKYTVTVTGVASNPTKGAGTVIDQGYWRRVGDSIQVRYEYQHTVAGAAGSGAYRFSLPSGIAYDTAKANASTGNAWQALGSAYVYDSTNNGAVGVVQLDSAAPGVVSISYGSSAIRVSSGNFGDFSKTTVNLGFEAMIPVLGWSSSVIMSSDAATNVVAARLASTAAQTGINPNNTYVKMTFDTTTYDNTGSVASSKFTVPVSGYYDLKAQIGISASNVLANLYQLVLYKNGSLLTAGRAFTASAGVSFYIDVADKFLFSSGDYVEVYLYGAGNNSASTIGQIASVAATYFNVSRISGPAQIAASEKIGAIVRLASSTAFNTAVIKYDTVVKDTHGAYSVSTGLFTCPRPDFYTVNATYAGNATYTPNVRVNGTAVVSLTGVTSATVSSGSTMVYCNAGDTIALWTNGSVTVTGDSGAPSQGYMSIRAGN